MIDNPDAPAGDLPIESHTALQRRRLAVILLILLGLVVLAAAAALWFRGSTAAPTSTSTIMGTSAPERLVRSSDATGVEVGTRFTARADGVATGMRFWKNPDADGPHVGTLWTAQGERLARASFTQETGSGWQTAVFGGEVVLHAGQTYVVSYYAASGDYAMTEN